MRHFLLLLLVGTAAAGYVFRDDLESAWSQWRAGGNVSPIAGMRSFGQSFGGQFERFGRGIDSLSR